MAIISGKQAGFGLVGLGGGMVGASMVPEGTGVLPPGTPSAAMMVGGIGVMGLGSAMAILSK